MWLERCTQLLRGTYLYALLRLEDSLVLLCQFDTHPCTALSLLLLGVNQRRVSEHGGSVQVLDKSKLNVVPQVYLAF